jgi:hypothetical protein
MTVPPVIRRGSIGRPDASHAHIGHIVVAKANGVVVGLVNVLFAISTALGERCKSFLIQRGDSEEAREIVEAERHEIELYEKYRAHYGYGVYIARRTDAGASSHRNAP